MYLQFVQLAIELIKGEIYRMQDQEHQTKNAALSCRACLLEETCQIGKGSQAFA